MRTTEALDCATVRTTAAGAPTQFVYRGDLFTVVTRPQFWIDRLPWWQGVRRLPVGAGAGAGALEQPMWHVRATARSGAPRDAPGAENSTNESSRPHPRGGLSPGRAHDAPAQVQQVVRSSDRGGLSPGRAHDAPGRSAAGGGRFVGTLVFDLAADPDSDQWPVVGVYDDRASP